MAKRDWKDLLDEDSRKELAELLDAASRHRNAYSASDDIKIAQLWSALVELRKETKQARELLEKLRAPFQAIVEVGEAEKRKAIEKFVSEIMRPSDETSKEAVKKLVDSLMKF